MQLSKGSFIILIHKQENSANVFLREFLNFISSNKIELHSFLSSWSENIKSCRLNWCRKKNILIEDYNEMNSGSEREGVCLPLKFLHSESRTGNWMLWRAHTRGLTQRRLWYHVLAILLRFYTQFVLVINIARASVFVCLLT